MNNTKNIVPCSNSICEATHNANLPEPPVWWMNLDTHTMLNLIQNLSPSPVSTIVSQSESVFPNVDHLQLYQQEQRRYQQYQDQRQQQQQTTTEASAASAATTNNETKV